MEIAAKTTSMFMLFLLIFVAGGILLQIFLSKRESKWPGLILPLLPFLYSLLMACSAVAYSAVAYSEKIIWGPILTSLILGNIPTVILLAIYAACREKRRKCVELDKMQISDL